MCAWIAPKYQTYNENGEVYTVYASNMFVQGEWALCGVRYNATTRLVELFRNKALIASATLNTAIPDRAFINVWLGREFRGGITLNGHISGAYVTDEALSLERMSQIAETLGYRPPPPPPAPLPPSPSPSPWPSVPAA